MRQNILKFISRLENSNINIRRKTQVFTVIRFGIETKKKPNRFSYLLRETTVIVEDLNCNDRHKNKMKQNKNSHIIVKQIYSSFL